MPMTTSQAPVAPMISLFALAGTSMGPPLYRLSLKAARGLDCAATRGKTGAGGSNGIDGRDGGTARRRKHPVHGHGAGDGNQSVVLQCAQGGADRARPGIRAL